VHTKLFIGAVFIRD